MPSDYVTVVDQIRLQIRDLIRERALQPGERLPAERQLAQELGVSRASLRQALTALRVEGLISVRRGDGIYLDRNLDEDVPPITRDLHAEFPELPALGEVRVVLESLAARLAASHRNDEDLAALVAATRGMADEIEDGETGFESVRAFHRAVLQAARNPVLTASLAAIDEGAAKIARASLSRPGQPPRSLAAHRYILEAIVAQDCDEAERLMHEHLRLTSVMEDSTSNVLG